MAGELPPSGEDEVFAPPVRVLAPLAGQGPALGAVATGGALGALARHGLAVALPPAPHAFPAATFLANVSGCLLIGVLLVLLVEVRTPHPLARPFLGTGVLGGYTTFSTYAVDAEALLRSGHVATAGAYLAGTLLAALAATWVGIAAARAVARRAAR